jgi:CheY-like chemotaxis protein
MLDEKVKLLIVDDDVMMRESFSFLFTELGYCVQCAEDGMTALLAIKEELPDIILSDLNMPGMSGFEFLRLVRQTHPTLPLIAMSGSYAGTQVPPGVSADVFFAKGDGLMGLIKAVDGMTRLGRPFPRLRCHEPAVRTTSVRELLVSSALFVER